MTDLLDRAARIGLDAHVGRDKRLTWVDQLPVPTVTAQIHLPADRCVRTLTLATLARLALTRPAPDRVGRDLLSTVDVDTLDPYDDHTIRVALQLADLEPELVDPVLPITGPIFASMLYADLRTVDPATVRAVAARTRA